MQRQSQLRNRTTRTTGSALLLAVLLAVIVASPAVAEAEESQQDTIASGASGASTAGDQPTGTTAQNFPLVVGPAIVDAEVAPAAATSLPAPPAQGIGSRAKLTGDWGGGRTYLADHGVDLEFTLSQFYQAVTSGGVREKSAYGGKIDYRFNFDASKLGLWSGFEVSLHAESRFGGDIGADAGAFAFPNMPLLYPLPGDYHGTDITGLMVMQEMFGGRAAVFGGKLNALDLVDGIFPQLGYGVEGFSNIGAAVTALPWLRWVNLSLWGGGVWTVNPEKGALESGVIFLGATNVTTSWSFDGAFDEGVGILAFHRIFYDVGDKPGYVLVAVGGSTKEYNSLDPVDWFELPGSGPTDTESGRPWDVTVYGHQVLWQAAGDDKRHADFFGGVVVADDNPSFSNWNFFMSLEAFGPFKSRADDRLGVAAWADGLSPDFVDLNADLGIDLRDVWGIELYYNAALTPWLGLTGDLQFVQNERSNDDVAVIPMARLVMTF